MRWSLGKATFCRCDCETRDVKDKHLLPLEEVQSYDLFARSVISMLRRIPIRLLAVPLILAVLILGVQVAAHFDGNSHDEAHCTCQVCHVAHAAVPQPAAQTQIQIPLPVAAFAAFEQSASTVDSASTPSIPRAPPA